ncbi:MAG TPA: hypothetical protein PK295_04045, partial [Candidatus Magasanikbacteria bacterium]|nr:hypothetical protein [Candidatus Magasanikbacteria bacterium]
MRYRRVLFRFFYRVLLKPIFFAHDPELIHDRMSNIGERLGKSKICKRLVRACFDYSHPSLKQEIWGINFQNPVGLAAGFDKEGRIYHILGSLGFGFAEVGTVTFGAYSGNPAPRLYRLPNSQGLVVNYGLKNSGVKRISAHLGRQNKNIPQIISIGKTNCSGTADEKSGIEDYGNCMDVLKNSGVGDMYEINISCPNTFGGEPFTTSEKLHKLLEALSVQQVLKPIILKMPINLP